LRRDRTRCAELLRASHIKPWADCDTNAERLDVYNGILLAPHLDAAFDNGLVTFDDNGVLVVSDVLDSEARTALGLDTPLRMKQIAKGHRLYLHWHRERVFRTGAAVL
jgi:predicted restriction endonuclease